MKSILTPAYKHRGSGLDVVKHKKNIHSTDCCQPAESCSSPEHISISKVTFNPITLLMKQKLDTHAYTDSKSAAAFFSFELFSSIRYQS